MAGNQQSSSDLSWPARPGEGPLYASLSDMCGALLKTIKIELRKE